MEQNDPGLKKSLDSTTPLRFDLHVGAPDNLLCNLVVIFQPPGSDKFKRVPVKRVSENYGQVLSFDYSGKYTPLFLYDQELISFEWFWDEERPKINLSQKSQYLMVPSRIHPDFNRGYGLVQFLKAIYDRSSLDCQIALEDLESLLSTFKKESYFSEFQKLSTELILYARNPNFEQQRFLSIAFPVIHDGEPPSDFMTDRYLRWITKLGENNVPRVHLKPFSVFVKKVVLTNLKSTYSWIAILNWKMIDLDLLFPKDSPVELFVHRSRYQQFKVEVEDLYSKPPEKSSLNKICSILFKVSPEDELSLSAIIYYFIQFSEKPIQVDPIVTQSLRTTMMRVPNERRRLYLFDALVESPGKTEFFEGFDKDELRESLTPSKKSEDVSPETHENNSVAVSIEIDEHRIEKLIETPMSTPNVSHIEIANFNSN